MPSVIGAINIQSNNGISSFGDTLYVSPKSAAKTFSGAGSVNTSNLLMTNSGLSATNVIAPHVADQNLVANA